MPKKKTERPKGVTAEAFSHMTAVLENIEQQNRATIEAVFGVERRLTERFETRFASLELRLGALEVALRMNSEEIAVLRRELRRVSGVLGADRDVNAITALENRVTALEARLSSLPASGH